MTNRRFSLPKDGLAQPDGGVPSPTGDSEDVEGHGLPITAPPSLGQRGPGHGGENIPSPGEDGDVIEGHGLRR